MIQQSENVGAEILAPLQIAFVDGGRFSQENDPANIVEHVDIGHFYRYQSRTQLFDGMRGFANSIPHLAGHLREVEILREPDPDELATGGSRVQLRIAIQHDFECNADI